MITLDHQSIISYSKAIDCKKLEKLAIKMIKINSFYSKSNQRKEKIKKIYH